MAFFRALETAKPPGRRLFADPYASALLSGPLRVFAGMARFPAMGWLVHAVLELGWPYTRSSGVVRTRAIDDLVREAIGGGAGQLVLLGAGLDSRAYRLPEAGTIAVFEVDHPATQQAKRQRLGACLGRLPGNVRFLAVDFEKDDLETRLTEGGFDRGSPAVAVWEGVVSYLTEAAVRSTLACLGRLLAPGSRLIFTYMERGALDGSRAFPGARRWRSWVKFGGEPFLFGFDPGTLGETLRPFGFVLQSDESTAEIARRYCAPLGRQEPGSRAYRVAAAVRSAG